MMFTSTPSRAVLICAAVIGFAVASPATMAAKVKICHKEKKTVSVSENALAAHKQHGDYKGECGKIHTERLMLSCGVNGPTHDVTAATASENLTTELNMSELEPGDNCAEALHLVDAAGCEEISAFGTPDAQTSTFACPSADSVIP